MKAAKMRLFAYSFSHFCVDFCCALLILPAARAYLSPALVYVLYNFFAFALQMPIGLLADVLNKNAVLASIGCGLTALGFAFSPFPVASVVVAGVGNALFHVGGGVDVLNVSGSKASSLGVFVSPGALGLYLGGLVTKTDFSDPWLLALVLMALCLGLIIFTARKTGVLVKSHNAPLSLQGLEKPAFLLPALCLFCVVVLRSLAGMTMAFPWKTKGLWGLAATLSVVLGKCFGGFAMDRLGAKAASVVSLLLSAGLFLLAGNPVCGTIAIFLFNMTMPVTLSLLARKMPGCKGFSFGLLTFALFVGFIPVGLSQVTSLPSWGFALLSMLSLLLLLPGLWKGDNA